LTVQWRRSTIRCYELIRRLASYVDRILKGAKPGDLSIEHDVRTFDQPEDGQSPLPRAAANPVAARRRGDRVRRRDIITLLGGAAAAWPLVVRAQQSTMPVIGFLSGASPAAFAHLVAAFHEGLAEAGYVEGQNVAIEYRWAEGRYDRLQALAGELVSDQVAVIVASGGDPPTLAAKAATSTIPIVFTGSDNPVKFGLVASLSRPGGNVTGMHLFTSELEVKKLELLHELLPEARLIAMLVNPDNPSAEPDTRDVQAVASAIGKQIRVLEASSEQDINLAFEALVQWPVDALLVGHDPFFNSRREQFVALAARHALPAIYEHREFVLDGGLMSYGSRITENYRQAGIYAGRILKGEKPADLAVQQATKFELVVNLEAAEALGIDLPPSILLRADEVIE
jgi:putative tryptophan/tyrosine transport system substrate-binding protein